MQEVYRPIGDGGGPWQRWRYRTSGPVIADRQLRLNEVEIGRRCRRHVANPDAAGLQTAERRRGAVP